MYMKSTCVRRAFVSANIRSDSAKEISFCETQEISSLATLPKPRARADTGRQIASLCGMPCENHPDSSLDTIRRVPFTGEGADAPELLVDREWLLTNGIGGYASGTLSGAITRRYHGLLVAALPAPVGRVVMLSQIAEELCLADGATIEFCSGVGSQETSETPGFASLTEFRLEDGLPVWL